MPNGHRPATPPKCSRHGFCRDNRETTDMHSVLRLAIAGAVAAFAVPSLALDEVSFGTNWLAEAEHGGYYQAVADGTYEKYGLNVTIRQGGPQASNRALLIGGQVQAYMGGVTTAIDAVKE